MRRETDAELDARIERLRQDLAKAKKALRAAEQKRTDRMCGGRRVRYVHPFSPEASEQRKTIHRLVDVGYKELAKALHPDRGGSAEDMARLNLVRDRLKGA